jgi:hypothetical protein
MNRPSRAWVLFVALGLYLTLRGYHSRDGDQAYRLPLLLNWQDPTQFATDPFVHALESFNPHRGYLALLDVASRPFGLSVGIFGLFAATFSITCLAIDRLARLCWPEGGRRVGAVAVLLVLAAKAGNLGTNHLFEAMLLDRLIALALGWAALAAVLSDPERGRWIGAFLLGAATLIHPSLGLQLGMMVGAGWLSWAILGSTTGVSARSSILGLSVLALALLPGVALMAGAGVRLMDGLSPEDYLTLSAEVQSPQHMLPHLWRMPQWLAWACFPILAFLGVLSTPGEKSSARNRLLILLVLNLMGLFAAWFAVERVGSVRATIFQPFRMATVARGLCLVLMANRIRSLWDRGDLCGKSRAALLVAGVTGDWAFVVSTGVELTASLASRLGRRREFFVGCLTLACGLLFLSRHDTESGHVRLIAAMGVAVMAGVFAGRGDQIPWPRRRIAVLTALAWLVPLGAIVLPNVSSGRHARSLAAHCRFGEWPTDDMERLAVWCRDNTPKSSRFVGPPGPKTFRLWARRELAFNRSASPYHAAGLADWARRFQDHVGFRGTIAEFASVYLHDRQGLERRFQEMGDADRADLARKYGADHVIASAPGPKFGEGGPLELLKVEGRYAVYRIRDRASFVGWAERSESYRR